MDIDPSTHYHSKSSKESPTNNRPNNPADDQSTRMSLSIDVPLAEQSRPNFDRKYTETSQDGEGESPGLDALAMVASGLA